MLEGKGVATSRVGGKGERPRVLAEKGATSRVGGKGERPRVWEDVDGGGWEMH